MMNSVFKRVIARMVVVSLVVTQVTQAAALTLATKPLAATTTSVVRPNLMYVLDDSGSMGWDYTPDYINDATITDPLNAGTGPAGSSGDTGQVTVSGGVVTAIAAVGGNSYYEQPTVVIEGGGGTGAAATANWNSSTKKITSVTVTSGGSGYTTAPFVTFVGRLASAAWGMCWGTTASSNQGGAPKDTSSSPQCTTQTQIPYATSAINYQYYDPAVRYEAPLRADGTRYANATPTAASSDGFLGGSTKNLTTGWPHEVWCNTSTASPSAADPTAGGKCRENSDTSANNLYPNASFNFRKTYNGPASYYTMEPSEFCTDTNYTNCVRSTTPTVVSSVTFNVPSNYRWCAYYNPKSKSFGGCQGRRDWSHYVPNYLGGWVSTGQAGVSATASLVVDGSLVAGQVLNSVTVGGVDLINGAQFVVGSAFDYASGSRAMNTASDVAEALCETIRNNTANTGYSCAQTGATVLIQASIVGEAPNGLQVLATGPTTAAQNSTAEIRVLSAPLNFRISSITLTRADASTASLISAAVVAGGNTGNTAQAICQAINSGPNQGTYIARSGDPANPLLAWGTCQATADAYVGIKRIPSDTLDNAATLSVVGPAVGTQSEGSLTINSTGGETVLKDVLLDGVSVLTSKPLNYADGTQTSAIAADVASKLSIAGCTTTATGAAITIAGTCTGTLAVNSTGTSAVGVFRVTSMGNTNRGDLGGIKVDATQLVGHLASSVLTDGSAVAANASILTTQLNNSTAANHTVGGVSVPAHGFSAVSAVNGSNYDITVTAPAGNAYNNKSFTFQAGTAAVAGAGSAPTWTFPISGATADNAALTSIVCGGTTAVGSRNTGTTGANVDYVYNLAMNAATNGLNGKVGAGGASGYGYACSNSSMASPQYRCTVTGPAGVPACTNLSITKGANISLSTTTPAAVGGTAGGNNKWTFTVTDASKDSKEITTIRCGSASSSPLMASLPAANTGTALSGYASLLEQGLDDSSASNWDSRGDQWSGSNSSCTPDDAAGTVTCTYRKNTNNCINPYIGVTGGLSISSQSPSISSSLNSGSNLSFTVGGINTTSQTVTEVSCAVNTVNTAPSTSDGSSGSRAERLAAAIGSSSRLNTDYWNFGSSSCTASGTNVSCQLRPEAGYCPQSGAADGGLIVTVSAGMSVNTPSFNTATGKWEFTISGADSANETVTAIRCRPNALGATATTGSTTIPGSAKVQRLENLRAGLNGQSTGDYAISCPATATDAAGFACEISTTGNCTASNLRFYGSNSSGITISPAYSGSTEVTDSGRQFGSYAAGIGATSPTWTFDILNATAANETISAISCGGSILPASAPSTGAASASTGYQRINNLTGATAGPPAVPGSLTSNGYTLVCGAATSTSPQPSCTLTGPVGLGACGATAGTGFVINADSSITFGAVSFTEGSTNATATQDFAPQLSTVTSFNGGRAAQGTTLVQVTGIATGPVSVSTTAFTNSVPSSSAIPTNATGTAPNVLTMAGGQAADTSTNHWTDVGIFKRIDIVPTNNSYSRASGRTDCTGSTCTYVEEMQNFANWYTYYRTRMQLMKSATAVAFSQLDGNYRVGFDNICSSTGTTVKRKVAQFIDSGGEVANQRTNWWTQLTGTSPSCATPLRAETAKIGRYYAGKLSGAEDPIEYSCQQNFMLLVTDGYWNENEPSGTSILATDIGNVDNNSAMAPAPYYDGAQASTVCPATGSGRGSTASSCRTLADIARYYYANDIRSFSKDVLVTTVGNHGLTPGQAVSITEVVSTPPVLDTGASFNGDVIAHVVSPTQFRYEARDKNTKLVRDPGTYGSGGRVKTAEIDVAISAMSYVNGLFGNQNNATLAGLPAPVIRDVSENNAITSSDDQNQHQHMNFFAMGLGIDGLLEYRSDYLTAGLGDYRDILNGTRNWPAVSNLDPTGVDDLWHATVNGHGKYFSARNLPNVVAGLREALTKIGARVGSAAAAATSNLQPVEGDNYAYVASYATLDWTGDLQSRSIDVSTGTVSSSTACTTANSGCQWSLQSKLDNMTWSARRIFLAPTSATSGDPLRNFNYGNLTGAEQASLSPVGLSQYAALSVSNPSDITTENLVNFLRGNRGLEQDGSSTHAQIWRYRTHILGDIVNTQPEFTKAPNKKYADAGYATFKANQANRAPVVFVSAQDGMLHAINAGTADVTVRSATVKPGEEMWAYIPKQALSSMKVLADTSYTNNHKYFVDGPLLTADVNFGNGDDDWHTILIGGLGAGGRSYFALDITNPLNPLFLWEIDSSISDFSNLGYSFGNPVVAKLPSDGSWAVLFTSGYNNSDGKGYLYAVNPKNGALKAGFPMQADHDLTNASWSASSGGEIVFDLADHGYGIGTNITVTGVTPAGYNGSYTIKAATSDTFTVAAPVDPGDWVSGGDVYDGRPRNLGKTAAWIDNVQTDNTVQYIYAGDLLGALWRFDLAPNASGHSGRPVFKLAQFEEGNIEQPITTRPQLTTAPNSSASRIVMVGTGKYVENSDLTNTDVQAVYAVKDTLGAANLGGAAQRTWHPRLDTVTVGGNSVDAFLGRKLISTKSDGSSVKWVDEYGVEVPGRIVCPGTGSAVDASDDSCINTVDTAMDWDIYGGWYVLLPESGERVNVDPRLSQGTLVVASNIPGASTCTIGGSAWINFFNYSTGLAVEGNKVSRYIPSALVVGITVIKLASGETKVIVTRSDYKQETLEVPVSASGGFLGKRSLWREFEAY